MTSLEAGFETWALLEFWGVLRVGRAARNWLFRSILLTFLQCPKFTLFPSFCLVLMRANPVWVRDSFVLKSLFFAA
jgi:hypothetical protein